MKHNKILSIIIVFVTIWYVQPKLPNVLASGYNSTATNDTRLIEENLRDDYLITLHKSLFAYLNKTEPDDETISKDYEDSEDSKFDNLVAAKRTPFLKNDPFPATRSPRVGLRSTDGYEANEVSHKSPEELIKLRGFGVETHHAKTKDGYHIHVVRIINPKTKAVKRPVIFNHGLFESATIWLMKSRGIKPSDYKQSKSERMPRFIDIDEQTAKTNCPFLLANSGYDVWLMSMRGTEYSLKHDEYNHKNDPRFWRYSLDHFSLLDIPAVIDYVITKTGATNVAYVGHSQATYTVFALLANKPKYDKILKPVFAVAPVSHFKHMTSVGRLLMKGVETFTNLQKNGPFPRNGFSWRAINQKFCGRKLLFALPCQFANALIAGAGQNWLSGFYTHLPYQSSLMVLRHFGQMLKSGRFSRYDYGQEKNRNFYKTLVPPDHPIERIKNRWITLIGGDTDLLSTPDDMVVIEKSLKVKLKKNILIKGFNHFDLITSDSAGKEVFEPILRTLEMAERIDKNSKSNQYKNSTLVS